MAQSVTATWHHPTTGALLGTVSNLIQARFVEEYNEVGEAAITVAIDNAAASSIDFLDVVRIAHPGGTPYGFEVRNVDVERAQESEGAGKLVTFSGPDLGVCLGTANIGGAVVYPGCGDPNAFQSDIRYFGWMDCCCFNHTAHGFSSPPGMVHRQDSPDKPWTPNTPEDWPDGASRRIFCSSPVNTVAGVNEVQQITLGTSINSGVFQLVFDGKTTANISSPWSAANVEAALEALSNIDGVTVTGAGIDSNPYVVTFDTGNVAARNVPQLSVIHDQLNHPPQTAKVTTTTQGSKGTYVTTSSCCYLTDTFSTANEMNLTAFINLSKTGEVFIDGVSIYEQTSATSAKQTRAVPITLPAGDHCITARVCKRGTSGLGWFMYTLAQASENKDGGYNISNVVHRTDASWKVLSTTPGATPPGATVGEIVTCLYDEARLLADPDLDGITLNFTSAVDSKGVAWADEFVFGVQIGTGYLDALQQLMDLSGYSWKMNEDKSLDIWQDRGTDRTASVIFTEFTDRNSIVQSSYTGEAPRATTLLVETQEGVREARNAAGVTNHGSRRLGLTIGTGPTYEGLAGFAAHTFSTFARPVWAASILIQSVTGLTPYANFNIDDLVTAPNRLGNNQSWRVKQIQMQYERDHPPLWGVALMDT